MPRTKTFPKYWVFSDSLRISFSSFFRNLHKKKILESSFLLQTEIIDFEWITAEK